jgi:tRNA (guanine37-N1)-methyltransferase
MSRVLVDDQSRSDQPLTNGSPLKIAVISIFPDMFGAIANFGITSRALKQGLVELKTITPRDFAHDRHSTVDDRPFGGGPGMVMMVQPLRDAIIEAKGWAGSGAKVIYLSPQGKTLDQSGVVQLSGYNNMILIAGRYEGIDERLLDTVIDEEWSIGDYVLSGGELPAMVLIDAVTRLIPGALGHVLSAEQDSFTAGLLDCPHYTRPEEFEGVKVPEVLLSGNHELIRRWRLKQALGRTWLKRPDLLQAIHLTEEQQKLLTDFRRDLDNDHSSCEAIDS